MPETLVSLSIILIVAFLLSIIFKKAVFSSVVGQIPAGMILGIPALKAFLFGSESFLALDVLSTFGIVFLLFLAGLEIDIQKVKETSSDSVKALTNIFVDILWFIAIMIGVSRL